MAYELKQMPLKIDHGHTDDQVAVTFSQPVPNLLFTPAQAEDFIKGMRASLEALAAHQKAKA
jgi:hypothetical protein